MKLEGSENGHLRYSLWANIEGVGLRRCMFFKSHTCFALFNLVPGGDLDMELVLPLRVKNAKPAEVREAIESAARQRHAERGWA